MWILWLICTLLLVIAVVLLVRPLFKRLSENELAQNQSQANRRKELNIKLFEQKKAQIELDFANGLLDDEARIQARNEIEHSLIQDAEVSGSDDVELQQLSRSHAKKLAIVFLLFIPVFSIVTYAFIKPENFEQVVLNQPPKQSPNSQHQQAPDINAMVTSLENKLKENPENIQGWDMLGRSYAVMKRFPDAVIAYKKAYELSKKSQTSVPELEINYVEVLMQTGGQQNYQTAQSILNDMLSTNPNDGNALWFMGFLDYEAGNTVLAFERWTRLKNLLPPNSEQVQIVDTYLSRLRNELPEGHPDKNVKTQAEVSQNIPQSGPAPGQQLTGSKEEQAFIAAMVARVENRVKENPKDLKGWKSLGKSYGVLNRHVDSANAYAKAVALDASDVELLINYSNAVIKAGQVAQLDNARIVFAQLLDQNPENADALYLSGSLARAAGDTQEARMFWNKLLPLLPKGGPAYNNVERNLRAIQ